MSQEEMNLSLEMSMVKVFHLPQNSKLVFTSAIGRNKNYSKTSLSQPWVPVTITLYGKLDVDKDTIPKHEESWSEQGMQMKMRRHGLEEDDGPRGWSKPNC